MHSFRPWTPLIVPPNLSFEVLERLLPTLVLLDFDYLKANPRTPGIYEMHRDASGNAAGIRYQAEPPGEEKWLTIPWVILAMAGDCEDLACWRAAELQFRGDVRYGRQVSPPEPAQAVASKRATPQGDLYHIRVRRASGRIEDPSAVLGMGWEPEFIERFGPLHGVTDPNEPWVPVRRGGR